jgi:hypothetical protein
MLWSSGSSGGIQRADIYNNTVYITPPADGSRPKAVFVSSNGISDITFRNNVFITSGGLPVVTNNSTSGVRMEGNCYWSNGAPLLLQWNGANYSDLQAWRAATGQERLTPTRDTGLNVDPQLMGLGANYSPAASSPLRGAALHLKSEFNIHPGSRDYMGNPTPLAATPGNIGALEASGTSAAPLPVVLAAFSVQQQGRDALLRWTTATEKDNAYFAVETSADGHTFTSLGQVTGHSNSSSPQTYQYTDQNLARYEASTVYYRLRQVDADGKAAYSVVRMLAGASASALGTLHAFPNPALTGATVVVTGGQGNLVQLFDVRGQLVASAPVNADGTAGLSVAGLNAGVYIVRCGAQSTRLTLLD